MLLSSSIIMDCCDICLFKLEHECFLTIVIDVVMLSMSGFNSVVIDGFS